MQSVVFRIAQRRAFSRLRWLRWASSLPEHVVLEMPALSPTMSQGNIIKWLIKEGEGFSTGDAICDIETDKATVSYDVQEDGYLAKIVQPDGAQDILVGAPIAVTVDEANEVAAFKDWSPPEVNLDTKAATETKSVIPESLKSQTIGDSLWGIPPAAPTTESSSATNESIANEDITKVSDSLWGIDGGSKGPSMAEKAQKAAEKPSPNITSLPSTRASDVDIPLTQMRRTIAKRLQESKSTIPHYQVTMECDLAKLNSARKALNEIQSDVKISVNDFVIKAAAASLRAMPKCNAAFMGNFIREFGSIDISVAVATPAGLITPIIKNADLKGLKAISLEMKDLAKRAKEGKLALDEFQGGSFTISNLGMFGVHNFNAIINPPQVCILAVGGSQEVITRCEKSISGFKRATVMHVTLSSDHRAVDGAMAAEWLQVFKKTVEDPTMMLL